jgi:2-oxoglutarate/2-oxoacid ferredoxin oxidoreductase subunit beta
VEHAFSISEMAVCAGAAMVGRGTVYHATLLDQLMEQAIKKRGFAVVEVISHCHTQFGAKNKLGDAVDMLRQQKAMAVRVDKARTMSPEELAGRLTIGVLVDRDLPVYTEEYQKIRDAARGAGGGQ